MKILPSITRIKSEIFSATFLPFIINNKDKICCVVLAYLAMIVARFVIKQLSEKMNINDIAEKNYLWVEKMGWHNKTTLEALALVASEVGEAINECRHEVPSDAFGEELADIILRVVDIAYWQGINIEQEIMAKMLKNEQRGTRGRTK